MTQEHERQAEAVVGGRDDEALPLEVGEVLDLGGLPIADQVVVVGGTDDGNGEGGILEVVPVGKQGGLPEAPFLAFGRRHGFFGW
jgi:hypothetical protein